MNFPRDLLVPTYTVGVLGAFLQISGGFWDVAAHIEGIPETFFTIQHMFLYAGVGLALLASVSGLVMRGFGSSGVPERTLLTGLSISLAGGALQVVAGPFDFWWHSMYGFDPFLFTPSHTLLIAGIILSGVGMTVGATRLLQASGSGLSLGLFSKALLVRALAVVSFATLWLVLNGLVYLITDVNGIAYTFSLGESWANGDAGLVAFVAAGILLAGTGALALLTARRTLPWRGSLSMVALIGAGVTVLANLSFRASVLFERGNPNGSGSAIASFIPLYLLFLVPVVVFDLRVGRELKGWLTVAAGGVLGPFVSYLDGFYSLNLWTGGDKIVTAVISSGRIYLILALAVPMVLAGVVGGLSRTRFTNFLSSTRIPMPVSTPLMRK